MDFLIILTAKYLVFFPIGILGIYFLLQPTVEKKRIIIIALPSLIITYLIALAAGQVYFDPRPFVVENFTPLIPHLPDNGFPSDHALLVTALATIGSYLNLKLGLILWVIAFIVAIARVYAGVHHPIDVIGSGIIAIFATSTVYFFLKYVWYKKVT